ncbi:hypothetical protein EV421DRAFT_1719531 [Armillaria borealis]|uniref:Uncharacterized protein n=1 Tax=Armillaria borealis TaxID=47425 RepID=A0AA39MF11_9AGAR|nr:hypothetical protein EV421DRAFT_1719531 [Armillaria borealis]
MIDQGTLSRYTQEGGGRGAHLYVEHTAVTPYLPVQSVIRGKTRPFNPVDLNNCRSHQSYYTALSRTAIAAGTLILPAPGNARSSPIDPKKIQGGCSGYLRQEFRELEMLDNITTQLYHDMLPASVMGDTRYSLIESYRDYVGYAYVPPILDTALVWSDIAPLESSDATDLHGWSKTFISHKPLPKRSSDSMLLARSSGDIQTKRILTPMKPAEKRRGRASDTFDEKQYTSDKRHATDDTTQSTLRPVGCKWSNNSCPYDATLFVLYNMWRTNPTEWTAAFESVGNPRLVLLAESFRKYVDKLYTLEEVRDYVRRRMHRDYPAVFVFGVETSVEAVMTKWATCQHPVSTLDIRCDAGHAVSSVTQHCCSTDPTRTGRLPWSTLQKFVDNSQYTPLTFAGSSCEACGSPTSQRLTYTMAPPLIVVFGAFTPALPDPVLYIPITGNMTEYRLAGIVYYGTQHFTARYVDPPNRIWFNDGIALGRQALQEGHLDDVDMSRDRTGKERDTFIYRRADI